MARPFQTFRTTEVPSYCAQAVEPVRGCSSRERWVFHAPISKSKSYWPSCATARSAVPTSAQQALDLIARILLQPGDRVAIENPSYQGTTEVLRAAAVRLLTVPVDRNGLDPARLPASARIVFVTPSHQFPTGAILPLARRLALLDWAKHKNAVIVEDDYDGEFRYEGQLLESLQGLDRDSRVIYIGTFSRTVFSAHRIGYLIVPKSLVPAFAAAKWLCDRHTPASSRRHSPTSLPVGCTNATCVACVVGMPLVAMCCWIR